MQKISLFFLVAFLSFSCTERDKTIKIGAVLPLTGKSAKYGLSAKQAIDMAAEEMNQRGGIREKKIEVVFEDDQGNPSTGVSAINRLCLDKDINAIIGSLPSSVTLAIAPVAENNRRVLISPASSNPAISRAGEYIFRNCISDLDEGRTMAEYSRKQRDYHNVAILYINNEYGVGLKNVFSETFRNLGGSIVSEETFNEGTTDFRAQLNMIKNTRAEAIYLIGYTELINALRQVKEIGVQSQILSSVMLFDPEIVKKAKGAANGAILTAWSYDPEAKDSTTQQFIKQFYSKYGQKPDIFAAQSYDALRLIVTAMAKKGFTADEIKDGLLSVKQFDGVSGMTSFDSYGDVQKPLRILRIKSNNFYPIEN